jgi:hypothetical protein
MIELECLAAAWAMFKCRHFLEGLPTFDLITDHRPLVPILNEYALDKLDNPRLLRLRLKMQRFSFSAKWIAGKANKDADALSRAPVGQPSPGDELGEGAPFQPARLSLLCAIERSDAKVLDPILEKVKAAALIDPVMQELRDTIIRGFPNEKCNLPYSLRPFWKVREQLAIDDTDDMVVVGSRVVIPKALQRDVLKDLLLMHQGATKLRQRARMSIYWPNIDAEIVNAARSCERCTSSLPSHPPEPLRPHEPATRPFEHIHGDLGEFNGQHFLVLVDQFSGWPHVVRFPNKNTSAKKIVDALREFFICVGAPVKFWSDNGGQFAGDECVQFLLKWGIAFGTSSPHYPQSNGYAEAGIKQMKKLISGSWTAGSFDADKFGKGLLLYRNAPHSGGRSPAQAVFGHPIRDCLPAHRRSFAPEWQKNSDVLEKRERRSVALRAEHYNRRTHPLPDLCIGNHVLIQHPVTKCWSTPGIIIEVGDHRDYLVKTPAGRIFRRNRRFLRRRIPAMPSSLLPATPSAPSPAAPGPAPQVAEPAQPIQRYEPAQPRQSSRPKKPSSRYPAHTWAQ